VEQYKGPLTSDGIEEHFAKKMPFAPSRYVLEIQRAKQAQYECMGGKTSPSGTAPQSVVLFGNVSNVTGLAFGDLNDTTNSDYDDNIRPRKKPTYKGDLDLEDEWLPENQNCKLFVTGVPADATRKEIFDAIKDGKVTTFSYNQAQYPRFRTAAFSISFADRDSSDRFFNRANGEGISIRGFRIKVVRDRTKMRALEEWESLQSRVIRVYGPVGTLSLARIIHVLKKFIKFDLVHGTENTIDGGARSIVTIHFESIVGQSRSAIKCLMNLAKEEGLQDHVHTRYLPDPCDPFPSFVNRDKLDKSED